MDVIMCFQTIGKEPEMKLKQGKLYEWNMVSDERTLDPSTPTHGEFVSSFECGAKNGILNLDLGTICVFENPDCSIFLVPLNMMAYISEVK